jgi:probable DNA metabolism protein
VLPTSLQVTHYDAWRDAARELLRQSIPPEQVIWSDASDSRQLLFETEQLRPAPSRAALLIPKAFLELASLVARHSDPNRWTQLYRAAWRITHGEHDLLRIETDDLVMSLNHLRSEVSKDIYRMRAFVRFRKVEGPEGDRYVAWYSPQHHTLDANGEFFVDRFGSMRWAILTPESSLFWNLEKLEKGPGVPQSKAPGEDELEDLWRLYYATIYNPARLNITAMRAQLPVRNWANLPEARMIPELVRTSPGRVRRMAETQPVAASSFIPVNASVSDLRDAIRGCSACTLCRRATTPVFGEGNCSARIMLVGEQPGDEEDLQGRPFVGPAGKILDRAFVEAGLQRSDLYVTNAVKAFRFEQRGKRRIHQTPRNSDIEVCRPWLLAEMEAVRPEVIVCLGATASQSVLGRKASIGQERGHLIDQRNASVIVTYHPSAVLRSPDERVQQQIFRNLVSDLMLAKSSVSGSSRLISNSLARNAAVPER